MASSGCTLTTIAFLKPAFSKATFHCKTALLIVSLHSTGVEFSIHHVIGSTGSDNVAFGSFFCKSHLCTKSRYGVELVDAQLGVEEGALLCADAVAVVGGQLHLLDAGTVVDRVDHPGDNHEVLVLPRLRPGAGNAMLPAVCPIGRHGAATTRCSNDTVQQPI